MIPLDFWSGPFLGNLPQVDFVDPRAASSGAVMWTMVALVTAAVLIPTIVVLGLFRLAALKRAKDLPPPQADEWTASQELQTPT
jgi:hypothetical protein